MPPSGVLLAAIVLFISKIQFSSEDNSQQSNIRLVSKFSNNLVPHLFKALSEENENLVFSPFGLASNLMMVIENADKAAVGEIVDVFKLGKNRMQLKRGFKTLNEEFMLNSLKDDLAGVFSRISVVTSQPLAPSFEEILRNYFQANVTTVHNETVLDEDSIARGTAVRLESEIGVVSHWLDYQKLAVYTYLSHNPASLFYLSPNVTVRVPMIPQIGAFRGGYVPQIRSYVAELKLQTSCMRLVLLMPNVTSSGSSEEELAKLSFRSGLDELLNVIPAKEMEVLLPQLAIIKKDIDLEQVLRDFGVDLIFNDTLVERSKDSVYIESIKQNAYFSTSFTTVNSASAIEADLGIRPSARKKRQVKTRLMFNKPFLFYLMHCRNGLILLTGKVVNPTQVPS
ncbi:serpin I2 isoform X2 [Bemisia tabaci]|uniref:serpin I2 isoform X2 n=1 Tax=Bemisia tabaci TaxID=7038 RepID=UPI003B2858AA